MTNEQEQVKANKQELIDNLTDVVDQLWINQKPQTETIFYLLDLADMLQHTDKRKSAKIDNLVISGYSFNPQFGHQLSFSSHAKEVLRFDYAILTEIFDYIEVKSIWAIADSALIYCTVLNPNETLQALVDRINNYLVEDEIYLTVLSVDNYSFLIKTI